MSIFNEARATCANCGNEQAISLAASVNADRRPDLRDAILDGTFQAEACAKCHGPMRLPAHLTYLDVERGQWILVQDAAALEDWDSEETEARGIFEENFGPDAPPASREIGEGLTPRLVFGWPALREKLIAGDISVQDVPLELMKITIVRDVPGSPIADQTELRLTGGDDDVLHFAWVNSATEQTVSGLDVPREVYRDIEEQPEDWIELREQFEGAFFVDMKRLILA
jgi:hypothetical protein